MILEKSVVPAFRRRLLYIMLAVSLALVVGGCASPPKQPENACKIFKEKSRWHKHTRRAVNKWKVDASVLLAIMYQESAFDANAKPKRKRFLGIPLKRPSSAFGYAQALDGTWDEYRKNANNFIAQRDRFSDAIDFIGWYVAQSRKRLRISPRDGYRNYLAYHEGWGGYTRGTYKRKKWLKSAANKVGKRAKRYRAQLARCGYKL